MSGGVRTRVVVVRGEQMRGVGREARGGGTSRAIQRVSRERSTST